MLIMGHYRCAFCNAKVKDTMGAPVAPHNCAGSEGAYGWIHEKNGSGCLALGTHILTPSGVLPIENFEVGDQVLSYDADLMRLIPATVIKPLRYTARKGLIVHHAFGTIQCTGLHTLVTKDGMRIARSLRPGHVLRTWRANEGAFAESVVEHVDIGHEARQVFNLRVTGNGTFVAENVVVHSFTGLRVLRQAWLNYGTRKGLKATLLPIGQSIRGV